MLATQNKSEFLAPCGQEIFPKDSVEIGLTSYLDALLVKCLTCKSLPCMKLDLQIENKGEGEVGAISVECFGKPIQIEQTLNIEP